jgi:adenine-specific DNA-methyltransferase
MATNRPLANGAIKSEVLIPAAHQEVARTLSAQVAEHHRLNFARSLALSIAIACWKARGLVNFPSFANTFEIIPLSSEATAIAAKLGASAAELEPAQAAYFIGSAYTAALPGSYRSGYGIFYTPPEIVEHLLAMAEEAGVCWKTCRVLDPACGGGAFLVPIALRMLATLEGADAVFKLQQLGTRLRGIDIDPFGAWLAQAMLEMALQDLAHRAGRPLPTIVDTRDSLKPRREELGLYDLVIGNPPYGRVSLPPEDRRHFQRSVYGHANLYGLFTDAALHWTKDAGVIGYVTPTSMLSGLYYKSLRRLLAREAPPLAVNFVAERDGVFADVLQETMLATYRKSGLALHSKVGFIAVGTSGRSRLRDAGIFSLPEAPTAPWLVPRVREQSRLVRRLHVMPYRLSDYGYGVSTGPLVWNRHKDQFKPQTGPDTFPVVWAESVTGDGRFLWRSERRNHAPWFKPRRPKDDWLIVTRPCVLLQRTTAKEQARRLIAAELPKSFVDQHGGVIVENHLNMVRPLNDTALIPAAVIAAFLNSTAVDAAFRCINGSVAVSAFELEELPMPPPQAMTRISQLVARRASVTKVEAAIAAAYGISNAAAAS